MKIIVTTSDKYSHILPIFYHLYNKYWGDPAELVGYTPPECLPENFTFHSLGKQRHKRDFSEDLFKYFEKQDDYFIWMMEDTFIKDHIDKEGLELLKGVTERKNIGRINLTGINYKKHFPPYDIVNEKILYENPIGSSYRISTQPSIWNRRFLLRYLTPGLTPWDFESQETFNDGYRVLTLTNDNAPLKHNEGVRRFDIHKYNLTGIDAETISDMQKLQII